MTRVSVIVPCHNYGRFLREAIESVDAQLDPPDEVVVCDDGSSDGSWEVMNDLAATRPAMVLVRHVQPHGLVRTFNELVERSTADIIVPLSADDCFSPTYVGRLVDAIDKNDCDFAYADYELFGAEAGRFLAPPFHPPTLARWNVISGGSAFTRQLFDAVGGYTAAFDRVGHEDWDFWLSAVEAGFVGRKVEGCEYRWRRHPSGSRNTVTIADRARIRAKLLRRHHRFYRRADVLAFLVRSIGRPSPFLTNTRT